MIHSEAPTPVPAASCVVLLVEANSELASVVREVLSDPRALLTECALSPQIGRMVVPHVIVVADDVYLAHERTVLGLADEFDVWVVLVPPRPNLEDLRTQLGKLVAQKSDQPAPQGRPRAGSRARVTAPARSPEAARAQLLQDQVARPCGGWRGSST